MLLFSHVRYYKYPFQQFFSAFAGGVVGAEFAEIVLCALGADPFSQLIDNITVKVFKE